ncbi:MAG: Crp/Fnr family transcriptional regulator [Bacteroidetes bacterium]|nr:Crp/Fnr family transcriptional regulator [Bacteroidota bacterium]
MHQALFDHMDRRRQTPLTDHERGLLADVFTPRRIRKHAFFIEQGIVCTEAAYVIKGAFKQYTIDEGGKEHVIGLFMDDWWVGDRESFTTGQPTPYYIEALEDSDVLVVNKNDFHAHMETKPFVFEHMNALTVKNSFHLLKRVHTTQALTAEERYRWFVETYPAFLQRFPLQVIASFLGMTKETLSRIRR